ncbi:MAG: AAA family ATPase [Cyanothece sp. SIO1E1]|nr:AAA family ATPase [Cyanothece sp. SIO1E1]
MPRWFNTAGPCKPDKHFMLPPLDRLPQLKQLIEREGYFVLHAPRQTGKTTAMLTLATELTASGRYTAVMVSAEVGAAFPHDPGLAERAILGEWHNAATFYLPPELHPPQWPAAEAGEQISTALQAWAQTSPRPLVLFIDEVDALKDEALISLLRQLRSGYPRRPRGFPQSLALIGLRDVRDYKVAAGSSGRLHTASPFNIKIKSLTLRDFTREEVSTLYQQHTSETGQIFAPEALAYAYELTQGQPWLVNALAKELVEELVSDEVTPITVELVWQAKEILIQRRDTHLDSLAERLREPRIRAIIEPMLAGQELKEVPAEDIQFVSDLGLCRLTPQGGLVMANPIYREVLPRVLTLTPSASLPQISPSWLNPAGNLLPDQLLDAFLTFWRQHGEPLLRSASYHEIAPHLVLMAFLHRVVNGGGTLEREYAIGTDRMDLCLRYGAVTLGIELKIWRDGRPDPLKMGLAQLDKYLAGLGEDRGWLVIFDRRSGLPPIAERTTTELMETLGERQVTVIRG